MSSSPTATSMAEIEASYELLNGCNPATGRHPWSRALTADIFENERWFPFTGWGGRLPTDRKRWSRANGEPACGPASGPHSKWEHGPWRYAFDHGSWEYRTRRSRGDFVRRRKWERHDRPVPPPIVPVPARSAPAQRRPGRPRGRRVAAIAPDQNDVAIAAASAFAADGGSDADDDNDGFQLAMALSRSLLDLDGAADRSATLVIDANRLGSTHCPLQLPRPATIHTTGVADFDLSAASTGLVELSARPRPPRRQPHRPRHGIMCPSAPPSVGLASAVAVAASCSGNTVNVPGAGWREASLQLARTEIEALKDELRSSQLAVNDLTGRLNESHELAAAAITYAERQSQEASDAATAAALSHAHTAAPPQEAEIPEQLLCPISGDTMEDPVVAQDGMTYSRRQIEQWFARSDRSPMTNLKIEKLLIPNIAIRQLVAALP